MEKKDGRKVIEGQACLAYLNKYGREATRSNYTSGVKIFLKKVYDLGKEDETLDYADRYLKELKSKKREFKKDIEEFAVSISGKPSTSVAMYFTAIAMFLRRNEFEVSDVLWSNVRAERKTQEEASGAISDVKILTLENFRKIFLQSGTKEKAFYAMLLSSGCRDGELLKLKLSDIEYDEDETKPHLVPWLKFRGKTTKNKHPRIAFISKESANFLKEWLKVRTQYIESSKHKSKGVLEGLSEKLGKEVKAAEKFDDNRVFPFEYSIITNQWAKVLKNVGLDARDETTGRLKSVLHSIRKYYRTNMPGGDYTVDMCEWNIGHQGYLPQYREINPKVAEEAYVTRMHMVTVFSDDQVPELKKELKKAEELKKEVSEVAIRSINLQNKLDDEIVKNDNLKQRVEDLENDKLVLKNDANLVHEILSDEEYAEMQKLIQQTILTFMKRVTNNPIEANCSMNNDQREYVKEKGR